MSRGESSSNSPMCASSDNLSAGPQGNSAGCSSLDEGLEEHLDAAASACEEGLKASKAGK